MTSFYMKKSHEFKQTFIASVGAGLEYYDFMIYGLMAPFISKLFFPSDVPTLAILKTFSIFALGYLFRPLGGIISGVFGDKYGRKTTLLVLMLSMSIATILIGCLPTYGNFGITATITLIVARSIQGLSYGAEMPGTLTFISETVSWHDQAKSFAIVMIFASIGSNIASLVLYINSAFCSSESILNGGWRIPFLLGGILAIVCFYLRKNMQEPKGSPTGYRDKSLFIPIKEIIYYHKMKILLGICLLMFQACFVITDIYFATYFPTYYEYAPQNVYLASIVSKLFCVIMLLFWSSMSDKFGCKNILNIVSIVTIASALYYLKFDPLAKKNVTNLVLFNCYYQGLLAAYATAIYPILTSIFPNTIRFTSMGICYNMAYLLASMLPMFYTSCIATSQSHLIPVKLFIVFACASFLLFQLTENKTRISRLYANKGFFS